MKWFIKVLKHYADFSGRARRKEYWMFVLFYLIFACVWTFLFALLFSLIEGANYDSVITICNSWASLSYFIVMMFPIMAVTIRRLHDTGQSAWMMFVILIPIIGGIWMLGLMLMEGQSGENKYGADSKTSPEIFDELVKLKNAGITLMVATITAILENIVHYIIWISNGASLVNLLVYAFFVVPVVLLLVASVFLTQEKHIDGIREKEKKAIFLLLIAFAIFVILSTLDIFSMISFYLNLDEYLELKIMVIQIIRRFVSLISYSCFTLLIASILFLRKNKNLIRNVAVLTIIFWGLNMLFMTYSEMRFSININRFGWHQITKLLNIFWALLPIAAIFLASVFLSRNALKSEIKK